MTSETDDIRKREFRNRPGRDLLVALAIAYVALAIPAVILSQSAALATAAMVCALVPVGLLLAIMKADLIAALGLALIVALAVTFAVRMPGYVRVPLLVAIFAGCYYCTLQAGTVIN